MYTLTVRKIGNALGIILPKSAVSRLRVAEGEKLYITEGEDGGFRITPYDPDFGRKMEIAEEGFAAYRDALHELAK